MVTAVTSKRKLNETINTKCSIYHSNIVAMTLILYLLFWVIITITAFRYCCLIFSLIVSIFLKYVSINQIFLVLILNIFSDIALCWYMHQFTDQKLLAGSILLSTIRFMMWLILKIKSRKWWNIGSWWGNKCFPLSCVFTWSVCFPGRCVHIQSHTVLWTLPYCLAPLRLKDCYYHSNTCLIIHNACPIFQSKCGEMTFWHIHVRIPASPRNPLGTSQHNYWVIHTELGVRIRRAKKLGHETKEQLHWSLSSDI